MNEQKRRVDRAKLTKGREISEMNFKASESANIIIMNVEAREKRNS
jgi:hypothetical protein